MRFAIISTSDTVGYQMQGDVLRHFTCILFAGLCCSYIFRQISRQKFASCQFVFTKTKTENILKQIKVIYILLSFFNTEKLFQLRRCKCACKTEQACITGLTWKPSTTAVGLFKLNLSSIYYLVEIFKRFFKIDVVRM